VSATELIVRRNDADHDARNYQADYGSGATGDQPTDNADPDSHRKNYQCAGADPLTQRLCARAPISPRNDPLLLAVAQALGKTAADLDSIFQLAASL
jgi:hypothetical protein